jgi:hypothetical protein
VFAGETALEIFEYGKNYFDNVATDYKSVYYGTVEASGTNYNYTERIKSSNPASTVSFYHKTVNAGKKILSVDARVGVQSYIQNGSWYWRSGFKGDAIGVPEGQPSGWGVDPAPLNLTVAYTDAKTEAQYKTEWGTVHNYLTGYIVNASTVSSGNSAVSLNANNQYEFTFTLNSGAHAEYKAQIAKYASGTGATYNAFTSLKLTYTFDINGRIIKTVIEDKYKMKVSILTVSTTATGTETITYGTDYVINENGIV